MLNFYLEQETKAKTNNRITTEYIREMDQEGDFTEWREYSQRNGWAFEETTRIIEEKTEIIKNGTRKCSFRSKSME